MRVTKLAVQSSVVGRAEREFIVTCARTRLDAPRRVRLRELIEGPLNWDIVTSLASQHHVAPLVHHHLSGDLSEAVPSDVWASLEEVAQLAARWNLFLSARLVTLLQAFKQSNVPAVPFKGPALASLAYGNVALRPSVDLDFVLPQQHLPRAYDVLIAAGFRPSLDPTSPRDAAYLASGRASQHCFFSQDNLLVELHTEKTLRYLPSPLNWQELTARLAPVLVAGHEVQTFSAEDNLVLLSVHGAKHFWERLIWISDLAELAQVLPGIDWEASERAAARLRCRRMWLLGLSLAHELLEAPLPTSVLANIRKDTVVAGLSRQVKAKLFASEPDPTGAPARFLFRLRSYDNFVEGLRQCVRFATQPTEEDWRAFPLPPWAAPLHAALRPLGLLKRHRLGLR
jgi:hypothetical protein